MTDRDALRAQDDEALRWAITLVRIMRDPALPGLVFFLAVVLVGFAAIAFGWRTAAATPFVPIQTPALVSGGLAGVALVTVGCLLAALQAERRDRAIARHEMDRLLAELAELTRAAAAHRLRR